ncbi:hypothetical protein ABIC83_002641 [Roseateles asaccharophilus]|uniref:hypothetical protein n=1 Tax=Roseateles asaccharophilus TaxID=582607 RepID=UPI0038331180
MQINATMTKADEREHSVPATGRPAQRADQVRARARKAMKVALGELLTQPEVSSLSAALIGALVSVAQRLLSPPLEVSAPRIRLEEARAVLQMRGTSHAEACGSLDALAALSLLRVVDGQVSIDAVDAALEEHFKLLSNRSQGWVKRLKESSSGSGGDLPNEKSATPAPNPPTRAGGETAALSAQQKDTAAAPSLPGFEPPAAASKNSLVKRFGASEREEPAATDPTVVYIPCKGDKTAEITRSYADSLKLTFRSLDVDQQLLLATNWCKSNIRHQKTFEGLRRFINHWMTKALEQSSMRTAVVQAARQANGFGQGGGYSSAQEVAPASRGTADDFDDLSDLGDPDLPPVQSQATAAPVVRSFRQAPTSFRARPGAQRRLSDPRGA